MKLERYVTVTYMFLNITSLILQIFEKKEIMTSHKEPTPEAIRAQLNRILQGDRFRGSVKQGEFLSFIVNETLDDRASQLKGYNIAVAVYGRKEGFNPQVDPIVRVEAGRLRRALEHYYLTDGVDDPVRIEIPKGAYVPTFRETIIESASTEALISERNDNGEPLRPSIAVMPLLNLTGDGEQDYFVDGITEELTAELARYEEFQVIASQSAMRFKGEKIDLREVGRDLGVQFLLTGSIRKGSKDIKVTTRLLDTSTAEQIWAESYKRDLAAADLIALQEEIAHRVVGAIADQYGLISRRMVRDSRKKAPADMKTYDAVLRFYHYETILTSEVFQKALEALEEAVAIDPEYGLVWAMLGHLHADNHALGFCEIEKPLEKALTFAQKGVALAPENQFARDALTLVYFHRGDKEQFLKNVEETISLNPNAPYIVGVSGWHMALYGEWERGLGLLKRGMRLNPYHPSWFHLVPYMDYYRRSEYENAFTEALNFNHPGLFWDPLMRAAALGQMGREQEARSAVNELLKLEPDFQKRGRQLISHYVKVGDLIDKIIQGLQKAGFNDMEAAVAEI
jgi:adenylate cyclase